MKYILLIFTVIFPLTLCAQAASPLALTCSPAPCILPNVQASEGGSSVTTTVLAANPNDPSQFVIGAYDSNCSSKYGAFSSSDGGSTWTQTCLGGRFEGFYEPIAGYDLNNVAYVGGTESDFGDPPYRIVLASSANNGQTWGKPIVAVGAVLGYAAFMPWLAVDTSPTSPNQNTLYISSTQMNLSGDSQIWISRSGDQGKTWSSSPVDKLQQLPAVDAFSNIAVGGDGTLYATWLRCPGSGPTGDCGLTVSQVMFSKSVDGGVTWSAASVISTITLTADTVSCYFGCLPNSFAPITNIPVLAADNSSSVPRLYAVFYNWTGSQMQVEIVSSSDGGTSWGPPVRVSNSNSGDEFLHWITVDRIGRVVVTWLDRRNDPANRKYQPVLAFSTDGGSTFSKSRALTTFASDSSQVSFGADYRNHITVSNATYAVWLDFRTGSWQTELGGVQF